MDRIKRKAAEKAEQAKAEAAGAFATLGKGGATTGGGISVQGKRKRRRRSVLVHGRFQLPESTVLRVIARSGPVRVWCPHGKSAEEVTAEEQTSVTIMMQRIFRGRRAKRRYRPQIRHRMAMLARKKKSDAVVKLQSVWRGKLTRSKSPLALLGIRRNLDRMSPVSFSALPPRQELLPDMKPMRGNAVKWGIRIGGTNVIILAKVSTVGHSHNSSKQRARSKLKKLKAKVRTAGGDAFGSVSASLDLDEPPDAVISGGSDAKILVITAYDPVNSKSCSMQLFPHELKSALATRGARHNPSGKLELPEIAARLARRIDLFISRQKGIMKLQIRSASPMKHQLRR